jgi:myo-inositol 2-dehydrogenase/D-chiro-inositol 1-dehydrogenase
MVEKGSLGDIHAVETACIDQQDPTGKKISRGFSPQMG